MKRITVVVLTIALLAASLPAFAGMESDRDITGDILFARPVGVVSVAVGAAFWVVSLPFALLGGNLNETTQTLISQPISYTLARPVGDFDYQPAVSRMEDQK